MPYWLQTLWYLIKVTYDKLCVFNVDCDVFYASILTRMDWRARKSRKQVSNTATVTTELCVTWWHVCWVPHELTGKNTSLRIHFRAKTSFPIEQKHWMIMDEQLAWCFSEQPERHLATWHMETSFPAVFKIYVYIYIHWPQQLPAIVLATSARFPKKL